jgi:hypothetical protein
VKVSVARHAPLFMGDCSHGDGERPPTSALGQLSSVADTPADEPTHLRFYPIDLLERDPGQPLPLRIASGALL